MFSVHCVVLGRGRDDPGSWLHVVTFGRFADIYHLRRYVGHVIGTDDHLNPTCAADHRRIEEFYRLTPPGPDEYDREFVASLNADSLVRSL
ncbi:hypothetical protein [Gordonia sp. NPDC003950]